MSTLIEETTQGQAPITPVRLRTRHDLSLVSDALERRAEDLTKLAKKTEEEGYSSEARTMRSDVGAIKEYILPQLTPQRELPLATQKDIEGAVADALRDRVHQLVRTTRTLGPAANEAGDRDRSERATEAIAARVAQYVIDVAERAFAAGLAARENAPEALALKSVAALGWLE